MTPTHILIPIEDIEALKIELNNEIVGDKNDEFYIQGKLRAIQYLENKGKQISLDEKDIITKAIEHSEELNEFNTTEALYQARISSYKQALKDIKNV